ncbi:hypothetical protein AV903_16800 [Erwinia tracheiphila]|uniref:Uncharacterized protein n=1 Tax=Erwinia tracheiphila TaxID=65700 RepID=A0A345CV53_9GAMM|nr:hypothetical protein AV903_16800 [Erwinia tracheiphila]
MSQAGFEVSGGGLPRNARLPSPFVIEHPLKRPVCRSGTVKPQHLRLGGNQVEERSLANTQSGHQCSGIQRTLQQ